MSYDLNFVESDSKSKFEFENFHNSNSAMFANIKANPSSSRKLTQIVLDERFIFDNFKLNGILG